MTSPADSEAGGRERSAVRRIARNAAYLMASEVICKVLIFGFFVIAARRLGPADFGVFSFSLAQVSMFSVFADLGLGVMIARELACDPARARRDVNEILSIKVVVSLLLFAASCVVVNLIGVDQRNVNATYISSIFILASALSLFYGYVFQGLERMELASAIRLTQAFVLIGGTMLLVRRTASALSYAWLYSIAGLLAAAVAWGLASTFVVGPGLGTRFRRWGELLKSSMPIGIAAALVMVYYWNGTSFLSRMYGDAEVGLYNAPFRVIIGLGFIPFAFSQAIYPMMSRMHQRLDGALKDVVGRSLRYMLTLALPLGLVGMALARPAVLLLYGERFSPAVAVTRVLVWWGALVYLNQILSQYFFAAGRARVVTVQTLSSLVVNVAGNIVLIPRLGSMGAATAIVAAEAVGFLFLLSHQLKAVDAVSLRSVSRTMPRIFLACAASAGTGLVLARVSPLIAVVGALAVYFAVILLVGGFDRSDIAILRLLPGRSES